MFTIIVPTAWCCIVYGSMFIRNEQCKCHNWPNFHKCLDWLKIFEQFYHKFTQCCHKCCNDHKCFKKFTAKNPQNPSVSMSWLQCGNNRPGMPKLNLYFQPMVSQRCSECANCWPGSIREKWTRICKMLAIILEKCYVTYTPHIDFKYNNGYFVVILKLNSNFF